MFTVDAVLAVTLAHMFYMQFYFINARVNSYGGCFLILMEQGETWFTQPSQDPLPNLARPVAISKNRAKEVGPRKGPRWRTISQHICQTSSRSDALW